MSDEWVVTMPKLGETVTEGTIGSWLKQAVSGSRIRPWPVTSGFRPRVRSR
jgi:hypothetical protein